MKIGIIGAGSVGGNLGKVFAINGHEVMFGVRNVNSEKVQTLLASIGEKGQAGSVTQAVNYGQIIILAIPWTGIQDVIAQEGHWQDKIVIDTMNPFRGEVKISIGEDLAALLPNTKVVKAFNIIGAEHYLKPQIGDQTASMLICSNDEAAKATVSGLIQEIGFDVVDVGGLENSSLLESLAKLWVTLARGGMGRDIGFRLLKG